MQTITYDSLPYLLSRMDNADQYFIKEPWQSGPPVFHNAIDMIAEAAAGRCSGDPLWTSEIVAQFGDKRDDPIIIAQIERTISGGFTIAEDSRHLLLIQKHVVYKSLELI